MKKVFNKRMFAIVILTIMLGLFFSMMTMSIVAQATLENIINNAPHAFNGVYGGIGGKALELAHYMPEEYGWVKDLNESINMLLSAAVSSTIPITFVTMMISDWIEIK